MREAIVQEKGFQDFFTNLSAFGKDKTRDEEYFKGEDRRAGKYGSLNFTIKEK